MLLKIQIIFHKKYLKERLFGKDDHKISSMLTIKKDLVLSNSKIENLNIGLKGSINLNGQKIIMGAEKKQSLLDLLSFSLLTSIARRCYSDIDS